MPRLREMDSINRGRGKLSVAKSPMDRDRPHLFGDALPTNGLLVKISTPFLLQNQHLPRGGITSGGQVIEIYTTCYLLTEFIFAIPINRF